MLSLQRYGEKSNLGQKQPKNKTFYAIPARFMPNQGLSYYILRGKTADRRSPSGAAEAPPADAMLRQGTPASGRLAKGLAPSRRGATLCRKFGAFPTRQDALRKAQWLPDEAATLCGKRNGFPTRQRRFAESATASRRGSDALQKAQRLPDAAGRFAESATPSRRDSDALRKARQLPDEAGRFAGSPTPSRRGSTLRRKPDASPTRQDAPPHNENSNALLPERIAYLV